MSKRKFTRLERYALKKHYGRCFWCDDPITMKDITVDHVLPEWLEEKPDELAQVIRDYSLPSDFKINSFQNWVPAHNKCNQEKSTRIYKNSPVMIKQLSQVANLAEKVMAFIVRFEKDSKKHDFLEKITIALEQGTIEAAELSKLVRESTKSTDVDIIELRNDLRLHVNSKQWKVVSESGEVAVVSDGRMAGITPTTVNPHGSWQCPYCHSYGPWNGSRCMTCGYMSDPYD